MTDIFTPEKRSEIMSKISGRDTKLEVLVRKILFKRGFRFRKNDKRLPGKPDIVLPKYKTVIFINGCFWHSHNGCKESRLPKTRTEFWALKINGNVERDKRNIKDLKAMGWEVIILWECDLKSQNEEIFSLLEKKIKK